ncbi:MAG: potassium transporter Kup [Alphaproteobacteria bacterium]
MTQSSKKQGLIPLAFLSLGIVYGDIGTSPLYTMQAVFSKASGIILNQNNILGAVSAIIWALLIIVFLKYIVMVLRADNRGEGGILALLTLAISRVKKDTSHYMVLFLLGVVGASLFLAESVITPSISVLGALEGLNHHTFESQTFNIVGLSVLILIGLFIVQSGGTAQVGKYFSYVMFVWFITLAISGAYNISQNTIILEAINPLVALKFLFGEGKIFFIVLAGVALAITGVEALYADMGHLGRNPIRLAWSFFVLPSLALNYMGQGAVLLNQPEAIQNPFYNLFPDNYILPIIILATIATIIASQAVISGTFSITRQAIQLGLLPRLNIIHKSKNVIGQIYIPFINWLLFGLVLITVMFFRSAENLAAAYGISVTMTMTISSILMFQVLISRWQWKKKLAIPIMGFFLLFDSAFFLSCLGKFWHGGWFTIMLATTVATLVITWMQGKRIMHRVMRSETFYPEPYIKNLTQRKKYPTIDRTAIYLVENPNSVPSALVDNLKHNMVLHTKNIFLTIEFAAISKVSAKHRLTVKKITDNFFLVKLRYGFMEHPDILSVLTLLKSRRININKDKISYFMSQPRIVSTKFYGMATWREEIFAWMYRNSNSVFEYFDIPSSQVVILGSRVQI